MGIFLTILKYIIQLAPHVILGIQMMEGDQKSGVDKKTMATDMLNVATGGALAVTTGQNQALAQIASAVVSVAIDNSVAIAKANGSYDKATAIANAVNTGAQVLGAVTGVDTANTPAPAPTVTTTLGK